MVVKVAKEFRWEMGHRLSYHTEGCANLHGHSYRMAVELEGTLDDGGMVIDYGTIKDLVTPLLEKLDHSTMLHDTDEEVKTFLQNQNMKVVLVPFYPTAENMAIWFCDQLKPAFQSHKNLQKLTVRLHETQSATAEVSICL